jgi:hypothetical protein
VHAVAVIRARCCFKDPERPIGSFIFLGPTGRGKTELARARAESLSHMLPDALLKPEGARRSNDAAASSSQPDR